ncbi:MAG: hypothetical protein RL134_656 [Actinomycetota bacterium]
MQEAAPRSTTGTVATAYLAMAATYVTLSSFEFVLVDMQLTLGFSTDSANALTLVPAAASLLTVFVAGSLADRYGPRRLLLVAAVLFVLGAILVGLATSVTWVVVGRALDGIGGVTMGIVGLSVINSTVTEPAKRARAFGVYAAITPAVFILAPVLTASIVESAGWRAGTIPWVLVGLATLATTWRFVPTQAPGHSGELLTPLLAGVALAGLALGITSLSSNPAFSLVAAATAVVGLVALVIAMRTIASPTLRVGWCRGRGLPILMVAMAVTSMPNLFFYTNLLLQYRFTVSLVVVALLLIVPQVFAVIGGLASGPLSARFGVERTAAVALAVSALTCLGTFFVSGDSPIWVPVLALSLIAAPVALVVGPITNAFLSRAPAEASGSAVSIRKAAWTLGGVTGAAITGALTFSTFQQRLSDIFQSDGASISQASLLAQQIRDGAVVDQLATQLSDPMLRDAIINKGPALVEAQAYAYHVLGILSAGIYAVAAVLMVIYIRRIRGLRQP